MSANPLYHSPGSAAQGAPASGCGPERPPRRLVVVGTTGSGKTTLAGRLASRPGVPHVELDALHWEANWVEADDDVFRERAARALAGSAWVVDGNYSKVRDIVWSRADTVVWLDYPLPLILGRLARRTFARVVMKTQLWQGNRESLRTAFLTRDSLFLWALSTYKKHRWNLPQLFRQPEYSHLQVVHLSSPRAARRWLEGAAAANPAPEQA